MAINGAIAAQTATARAVNPPVAAQVTAVNIPSAIAATPVTIAPVVIAVQAPRAATPRATNAVEFRKAATAVIPRLTAMTPRVVPTRRRRGERMINAVVLFLKYV